jgi:hypothetical protein
MTANETQSSEECQRWRSLYERRLPLSPEDIKLAAYIDFLYKLDMKLINTQKKTCKKE